MVGCGNKFLTWLLNSLIQWLSSRACLVLRPCNCWGWMSPPSKLTGTPAALTHVVFTYTCSQLRREHATYEQVVFQLAGLGLRRQYTPWTIQQFIAGLQTKSPTNLLNTLWYLINSRAKRWLIRVLSEVCWDPLVFKNTNIKRINGWNC